MNAKRTFTLRGLRFRVGDRILIWWTNSTMPARVEIIEAYDPKRGRCSLSTGCGWMNPRHKAFRCERTV